MVDVLVLVLIWLVTSEGYLVFKKRSKRSVTKEKQDRYSLLGLWIIITVSITSSVYWAANHSFQPKPTTVILGLVLVVAGSTIRWLSIKQLKEAFTVDLSIKAQHKLSTSGMYKWIRHPSYAGLILYLVGIGVILNNLIAMVIILIVPSLAIGLRINLEEGMLIKEFKDEYRRYQLHSKKIIPFIY